MRQAFQSVAHLAGQRTIANRGINRIAMDSEATSERQAELKANFEAIKGDLERASDGKTAVIVKEQGKEQTEKQPRLVLVSKLKPPSDILAMHKATGHVSFGENYIQELAEKAEQLPSEIQWHFIGALQTNKCKVLAGIPNLAILETLDAIKKADALEKALATHDRKLKVFLQVNTSSEDSKAGLSPLKQEVAESAEASDDSLPALAKHVLDSCPHLTLAGLMTIGSYEQSHSDDVENQDFKNLIQTRRWLASYLKMDESSLELSMGMSADFEAATKAGSSNVRVGSRAFGQRPSKEEAKAQRESEKVQN